MQEDYTGYLIKINKTIYYVKKDDGTYLYCDKVNYNAGKNESNYETTVKILKNSKYKIYDDLSDVNPAKKEDEKKVPEPWDIIKTSSNGYLKLVSNKIGNKLYVVPIKRNVNPKDKTVDFKMVNDNRNLHLMVDKIHSLDINSVGKVLVDKPLSTYMKNKFIKELIKYNDLEKIDLSDLNFELKKGIVIVDNNDNIGILGARQDDGKFNSYGLTQSKENKDAILIGGYKYQIDYHKRKVIDDSDVKFFVTEGFEKLINPPKKSKQKKYKIGREVNLVGTKEKVIIIDKIQDKYLFVKSSDEGVFLGLDKKDNLKIESLNRVLSDEELIEILLKIEKVSNNIGEQNILYLPKQTKKKIESRLQKTLKG